MKVQPFNTSEPIVHDEVVCKANDVFVIEGAEIIHALTPINNLTKLPDDVGSAIRTAVNDPSLAPLVDKVLLELPAIQSDSRLSDGDKLDLIVSHLDLGTPTETDRVRLALMELGETLLPKNVESDMVTTEPASPTVIPEAEK